MNSHAHVDQVTATLPALAAMARLRKQRGPVVLYQSGSCCDDSLLVCFDQEDLQIGDGDVLLGFAGECPVYVDERHHEVWEHTQLIIDVTEGKPAGLSLAAGADKHFVSRSRVFAD